MMIKDIGSAQQAMPNWETYQKGLEALAMALGSAKGSEEGVKKALTINDLLVKVYFFSGHATLHENVTDTQNSLYNEFANTHSSSLSFSSALR